MKLFFSAYVLRSATNKKCHYGPELCSMQKYSAMCLQTQWTAVAGAPQKGVPPKGIKHADSKINIHIEYIDFLLSLFFFVQKIDKNESCSYSAAFFFPSQICFSPKIENGIF
ncbi:hypothetical protein CEXT_659431 [Caerostris extrusa]|uniref:Uncharacterized protein n=1 Tax=Caerostris extrusa TaxID=172846 RepID=A0AAV4M4T0_CAEEX|nr:hypothetical protein CEXT_659431 [Caerostris extrusa]